MSDDTTQRSCTCCGNKDLTVDGCVVCLPAHHCACGEPLLCLCGRRFEHGPCPQELENDFVAEAIANCDADSATVYGSDKLARVAIKALDQWRQQKKDETK